MRNLENQFEVPWLRENYRYQKWADDWHMQEEFIMEGITPQLHKICRMLEEKARTDGKVLVLVDSSWLAHDYYEQQWWEEK